MNSIKRTIVNALKIYGLHVNATSVDVKFTLVMVALEGLVLTKRDLNYLEKGLSEKVAFLTEKQPGEKEKKFMVI